MTIKLACALSLTASSSNPSILLQWVFALLNIFWDRCCVRSKSLTALSFCFGVLKSTSDTGKYSTLLNDGGSHAQGSEVQLCCFFYLGIGFSSKKNSSNMRASFSNSCHAGAMCCHLIYSPPKLSRE